MLLMSSCRSRGNRLVSLTQLRDELRRVERDLAELRVENEILREAAEPLIHHAPGRERKLSDLQVFEWILEVHTAHPAYGAVRVTRELKACGFPVGCRRVVRIMRERGVRGLTRRRRRNLTKADQG